MTEASDPLDPKGLIREAFAMDLSPAECRSILLDWALSLPSADLRAAAAALLLRHGGQGEHPLAAMLREATAEPPARGRRGGWAARPRPTKP